jgi:hypothetical protein
MAATDTNPFPQLSIGIDGKPEKQSVTFDGRSVRQHDGRYQGDRTPHTSIDRLYGVYQSPDSANSVAVDALGLTGWQRLWYALYDDGCKEVGRFQPYHDVVAWTDLDRTSALDATIVRGVWVWQEDMTRLDRMSLDRFRRIVKHAARKRPRGVMRIVDDDVGDAPGRHVRPLTQTAASQVQKTDTSTQTTAYAEAETQTTDAVFEAAGAQTDVHITVAIESPDIRRNKSTMGKKRGRVVEKSAERRRVTRSASRALKL